MAVALSQYAHDTLNLPLHGQNVRLKCCIILKVPSFSYVLHSSAVQPLWDMGIEQFRSLIVDNTDICTKCVDDFVTLLDRERDAAGQVNTSALVSITRMFIAMQCYEQVR